MTLHQIWLTLKRAFGLLDDDRILDHVPINGDKNYRKKLAKARERHGKEFHTHEKKARETPPSHDLVEIQATSIMKQKGSDEKVQSIKKLKVVAQP